MKFDAEDPKVVTEGEKVDRSQGAARAISVSDMTLVLNIRL